MEASQAEFMQPSGDGAFMNRDLAPAFYLGPQTCVTAGEFLNSFGMLSDKAWRQPVVITKHGHEPRGSPFEAWERLKRRDQRVGLKAEVPSSGRARRRAR